MDDEAQLRKYFPLKTQIEEFENLLLLDELFATLPREEHQDRIFSCSREVLDTFDATIAEWTAQGKCHRCFRNLLVSEFCRTPGQFSLEYFACYYIEDAIGSLIKRLRLDAPQIDDDLRRRLLACFCKTTRYGNLPNEHISLRHLYLVTNAGNWETFFQSLQIHRIPALPKGD